MAKTNAEKQKDYRERKKLFVMNPLKIREKKTKKVLRQSFPT